MHIPVDGEQVQVVEVSQDAELVDAALTSLGGSALDEMDEVRGAITRALPQSCRCLAVQLLKGVLRGLLTG